MHVWEYGNNPRCPSCLRCFQRYCRGRNHTTQLVRSSTAVLYKLHSSAILPIREQIYPAGRHSHSHIRTPCSECPAVGNQAWCHRRRYIRQYRPTGLSGPCLTDAVRRRWLPDASGRAAGTGPRIPSATRGHRPSQRARRRTLRYTCSTQ